MAYEEQETGEDCSFCDRNSLGNGRPRRVLLLSKRSLRLWKLYPGASQTGHRENRTSDRNSRSSLTMDRHSCVSKKSYVPQIKKIPMKDLAELTERYREACDRLLTKENPNCRGNIGLIHLYFEPSSYMTGRSSTIFELRRAIERDEKTGEKKGFRWSQSADDFDEHLDMFIEDGTAHPK